MAHAFVVALFAFLPATVGGHSQDSVAASMGVDPGEASPGDSVRFWISIDPLTDSGRNLVVVDGLPEGLAIVTTMAPSTCEAGDGRWVCAQGDLEPFSIEMRALVEPGTEGQELTNVARIEVADDDDSEVVTVQASIHVVPPQVDLVPHLDVLFSASQAAVVPDSELNYRIGVTNDGTAPATNVSVTVSMPAAMVLVSASPWPIARTGGLEWTIESMPVDTLEFLFNTTVPASSRLTVVLVEVAVAYAESGGESVLIKTHPSTLSVVPGTAAPPAPLPGLLIGFIAVVAVCLLVAQRIIPLPFPPGVGADEIFLLHRSGVVLNHFSAHPSRHADSDIVGGMMAAVRMFVEDSVNPNAGPLREIRFGRGNILFVPGDNVTLAAVNARGNGTRFAARATRFLQEFERLNQDALSDFDGNAGGLEGIEAAFRKFIGNSHRRALEVTPDPGDVPRQ